MTSRVSKFVQSMGSWDNTPSSDGSTVSDEVVLATAVDASGTDLLDPNVLASIGGLELVSRLVVDGTMSGIHRSSHRGGCSEFEDHRPYSNGDELRHLDWRLLARRDRYYVKQFTDETNLQAWIVLDSSGSMQFGMSTITKYDFARTAAACLARLLLKQRDSVGLATNHGTRDVFLPSRPRSSHFQSLLTQLAKTRAIGVKGVEHALDMLSQRIKRRGLVLVFSDALEEIQPLVQRMKRLRARGNDVILFQILAPEEVSFDLRGDGEFIDLENAIDPLEVDIRGVRHDYLRHFQQHMAELDHAVSKSGCDRVVLTTDQPLSDVLTAYLHRRHAMVGAAGKGR